MGYKILLFDLSAKAQLISAISKKDTNKGDNK